MEKSTKKLVFAGAAAVIAIVVVLVLLSLPRIGKVKVNIETLPEDSTVTLDGKKVKSNGALYVTPGKHTLKASRQYFTTVSASFDTAGTVDDPIYLMPGAESDEALRWLELHPKVSQAREAMGGMIADRDQANFAKKYPVAAKLPYETFDYKIGYSLNDDNSLTYDIQLYTSAVEPGTDLYQQQLQQLYGEALTWLRGQGVDTSKAKINVSPDPAKVQITN